MVHHTLTVSQVAKIAGVSNQTVRRWTDRGLLPCVRFPGSGYRRYRRSEVEAFVAALVKGEGAE